MNNTRDRLLNTCPHMVREVDILLSRLTNNSSPFNFVYAKELNGEKFFVSIQFYMNKLILRANIPHNRNISLEFKGVANAHHLTILFDLLDFTLECNEN